MPNSNRIALRLSTKVHTDRGADTDVELPMYKWSHVCFVYHNTSKESDVDENMNKNLEEQDTGGIGATLYIDGTTALELHYYGYFPPSARYSSSLDSVAGASKNGNEGDAIEMRLDDNIEYWNSGIKHQRKAPVFRFSNRSDAVVAVGDSEDETSTRAMLMIGRDVWGNGPVALFSNVKLFSRALTRGEVFFDYLSWAADDGAVNESTAHDPWPAHCTFGKSDAFCGRLSQTETAVGKDDRETAWCSNEQSYHFSLPALASAKSAEPAADDLARSCVEKSVKLKESSEFSDKIEQTLRQPKPKDSTWLFHPIFGSVRTENSGESNDATLFASREAEKLWESAAGAVCGDKPHALLAAQYLLAAGEAGSPAALFELGGIALGYTSATGDKGGLTAALEGASSAICEETHLVSFISETKTLLESRLDELCAVDASESWQCDGLFSLGRKIIEVAAAKGFDKSLFRLGVLIASGIGEELIEDCSTVEHLSGKSCRNHDGESVDSIRSNRGSRAGALYHAAAMLGDTRAKLALGQRYSRDEAKESTDCETAAFYFRQVAAAAYDQHHTAGEEPLVESKLPPLTKRDSVQSHQHTFLNRRAFVE